MSFLLDISIVEGQLITKLNGIYFINNYTPIVYLSEISSKKNYKMSSYIFNGT